MMRAVLPIFLCSCFQPWQVNGLYRCGEQGECPESFTCDDSVCCNPAGDPACPTLVPDSGVCLDGGLPKNYFSDADKDGFGNPAVSRLACSKPLAEPFVDDATDCDDTSAAAHPGGTEICDCHDNDCNGVIDEGQTPLTTFYRDTDGDGFGDSSNTLSACSMAMCTPPGYSAVGGDCDIRDPAIHPGAAERCNGADDNCNGQRDELPISGVGDACSDGGIGLCAPGTLACVGGNLVCRSTYVPKLDVCDGQDNDCDGLTDERPDCGGPSVLLMTGASVTGARDMNTSDAGLWTPTGCLKTFGVGEGWTPPLGPWSGSRSTLHLWYAEAPGNTTWDLTRPADALHLQFRSVMLNGNTAMPWTGFNQPMVLVCNTDPTRFSRYRPLTQLMAAGNMTLDTNLVFARPADGGWLNPAGGADLTAVKRIEVVIEPQSNGAMTPGFTINFDNSTGFIP
jgi:hypothetical protein